MPLPLTISCSSKIQIGFTFLVPAHPGSPVCVCVCVRVSQSVILVLRPMSHLQLCRTILSHECATLSHSSIEWSAETELRDREKLARRVMSHWPFSRAFQLARQNRSIKSQVLTSVLVVDISETLAYAL